MTIHKIISNGNRIQQQGPATPAGRNRKMKGGKMNRKLAAVIFAIVWIFVTLGSTRVMARVLCDAAERSLTPQRVEEQYQALIDEGRNPEDAAMNAAPEIFLTPFIIFFWMVLVGLAGPFVWGWGAKKFLPPLDDYKEA